MNKILLDNNQISYEENDSFFIDSNLEKITILKDTIIFMEANNTKTKLDIDIMENVKAKINITGKESFNNITYNIKENASVIVNKLVQDNNDTIKINLNGLNAKLIYNYNTINYQESNYQIDVKHNNSKTTSYIYNHGISMNDKKINFNINGYVYPNSSKCICNQDNKIIHIKENTSVIEPKLYIENYDVEANHSAYIGTFKKDQFFYLMSRGVTEEDCYQLFIKSFILGKLILDKDEMEIFQRKLEKIL